MANISTLDETQTIQTTTLADPQVIKEITEFLCDVFALHYSPHWNEALAMLFLPTVPDRFRLVDPSWWHTTREVFTGGSPDEKAIYSAAWQLLFDGGLHILGFYGADIKWREDMNYSVAQIKAHGSVAESWRTIFSEIADATRDCQAAPLRVAHCIRDLCYGDESRADDLVAMLQSEEKEYRDLFTDCYWLPTKEEARREAEQEKRMET